VVGERRLCRVEQQIAGVLQSALTRPFLRHASIVSDRCRVLSSSGSPDIFGAG
jgi:hypothetical protein